MAGYADMVTDQKLSEMEKHIAGIYKQASDDLQKKSNEYFSSFAARYEKEYDAYLQGAYTDQQFKAWYYAQVGRGERWQTLKTDMAKKMTQANQIAAAYVNDQTPGIYSLNANYSAYEIEKGTGTAFNLVNEETVRKLMNGENFTEFRTLSVNPTRDYNWNTQRIQNALLSGILQGDSIKTLADRYMEVMGSNRTAAIRNARTAVTSAQNGGRQSTFNRAQRMGINLDKEWIATNDSRTRDSHRQMDGVRVKNDDPFPNGCRFPGDPGGEPAEVYNCRCTMRAILPKYNGNKRMTALNGGANTQASYVKWVFEKSKKAFTSNNESVKIDSTNDDTVRNAIETGKVSIKVKEDLQKRHIKDSDGYIDGRSYIYGDLDTAQELINKLNCTGSPILDGKGNWTNKERVENDTVVGIYVDKDTKEERETNKAMIIYSKSGSHIMPRKDEK